MHLRLVCVALQSNNNLVVSYTFTLFLAWIKVATLTRTGQISACGNRQSRTNYYIWLCGALSLIRDLLPVRVVD